jgi:hypothetical protein
VKTFEVWCGGRYYWATVCGRLTLRHAIDWSSSWLAQDWDAVPQRYALGIQDVYDVLDAEEARQWGMMRGRYVVPAAATYAERVDGGDIVELGRQSRVLDAMRDVTPIRFGTGPG